MSAGVLPFVLVGSGLVSALLTGVVRHFALRTGVIDHPNHRSSHTTPTPRGGGVAILLASTLAIVLSDLLGLVEHREALVLCVGMILLGMVGWRDDRGGVRPSLRLAIQFAIALWTVWMLGGLPSIQIGNNALFLGITGYVVATVGIVWSINLFNFMDGIDGLAGSQAVIIFSAVGALLFLEGDRSLGVITSILAVTSAGFLIWNWPPAKIFLGDVGSGAMGYLIAGVSVASENHHSVPLLAVAIVYAAFVGDATVTLLRRFRRGSRVTEAHREHAYQRLTRTWGSHRAVTLGTAAVTTAMALLGAVATIDRGFQLPALLIAAVLLSGILLVVEHHAPM